MKLEVKAERKYRHPQYPAMEAVRLDPELLRKLPERWRGSAVLCMALVLSVGLAGCEGKAEGAVVCASKDNSNVLNTDDYSFLGAYTRAVHLSEQAALEIICDEAAKRGVNFSENKREYLKGGFPTVQGGEDLDYRIKTWDDKLLLDGYDRKNDIGFEFISQEDFDAWASQILEKPVYFYRYSYTANKFADTETVKTTAKIAATFYDPGVSNAIGREYSTESKEEYVAAQMNYKEELLRQQVRDFLDWLAAEGVI